MKNLDLTTVQSVKIQSAAFQIAHAIRSSFGWSEALRKGWALAKAAQKRPTPISFAKCKTGEVRDAVMVGILSLDTINKDYIRFIESTDEGEQIRSFKISRLV